MKPPCERPFVEAVRTSPGKLKVAWSTHAPRAVAPSSSSPAFPSIKELGVGCAVAIALAATLVRLILVPAAMKLMGDWNWWMPPG